MKTLRNSKLVIVLSLCISLFFQSCTLFIYPKTTVKFSGQSENSKLKLYAGGDSPINLSNSSNGKVESYNLTSGNRFYLITQEKEGFVKQYNVIIPTKFNYLRAVDAIGGGILMVLGIMKVANGDDRSTDRDEAFSGLILAGAGVLWIDGAFIPTKLYNNTFEFPAMVKFIKRQDDQRFLFISNMGVDMKGDDLKVEYFKNWKKYTAGSPSSTEKFDDKIKMNNTIFTDEMNQVLYECNFIDTTGKLIANNYNSYFLDAEIKKIHNKVIYYGMQNMTVTIEWKLKDYITKETVMEQKTEVTSDFFPNGDEYFKDGVQNCLEKSMFKLLEDANFNAKLKSENIDAKVETWDEISITNSGSNAADLASIIKSSVIITVDKGHGSGVIISKDGYMLSNYHVVGNNSEVDIIFSDQTKTKAKVLRTNPKYDLALLKIEGKEFNPPLIDLKHPVAVTNEVMAIGTPTDIELGQTITKGIVSGFRDNGDFKLIQTDAKISPGNSGGALIDKDSKKLVGIVNAKIIGFGVEGIGFAIPIEHIESSLKIKLK